jgi:long-subunit fatty acid transport protein
MIAAGKNLLIAVAAAAVSIIAATAARANPVDAYGLGARAPAMGNAQTAGARGSEANYYNPALLATFGEYRFDVGYQLSDPDLRINDRDLNVNRSRGFALGMVLPSTVGGLPAAIGFAAFLPDEELLRIRVLRAAQPRFVLYDNRPQRLYVAGAGSIQISPKLAVGGGLAFLNDLSGGADLTGRIGYPDSADSELVMALDNSIGVVSYPQAGILYRPVSWLDLGAAYRGGFELNMALDVRARADIGTADGPPLIDDMELAIANAFNDFFQPEQYAVGVSVRVGARLLLALDVVYHRWSEFKNPAPEIRAEGTVGTMDLIFEGEGPVTDPGFTDIVVPHLGMEWTALQTPRMTVHLRGGYTYEPTPAPEQTKASNFADNNKHTGAIGIGMSLAGVSDLLTRPFEIDVFGGFTYLEERLNVKESALDPFGDFRASGQIVQVGVGTRWRF